MEITGNIEKISLEGDDKDKVEVIGDVDPIELTERLRKCFGSAQLESVSDVKKKDDEEDKDKPKITWTCSWGVPHQQSSYCHCYVNPYPSYSSIW